MRPWPGKHTEAHPHATRSDVFTFTTYRTVGVNVHPLDRTLMWGMPQKSPTLKYFVHPGCVPPTSTRVRVVGPRSLSIP
jgi:hypothetical protein